MNSTDKRGNGGRPRATELVRSIVINAELADPHFRVVAVDIYSDAVAVRWTREWPDTTMPLEEDWLIGPMGSRLDTIDDLGTEYDSHGGGGGTLGIATVHATRLFSPPPPTDARELVLTYADHSLAVSLRD
jgi:hypothetical protein